MTCVFGTHFILTCPVGNSIALSDRHFTRQPFDPCTYYMRESKTLLATIYTSGTEIVNIIKSYICTLSPTHLSQPQQPSFVYPLTGLTLQSRIPCDHDKPSDIVQWQIPMVSRFTWNQASIGWIGMNSSGPGRRQTRMADTNGSNYCIRNILGYNLLSH